jgi:hypothetical protein
MKPSPLNAWYAAAYEFEVACGDHCFVHHAEGRCTHTPGQETRNPSACVRAFRVVRRHRFTWRGPVTRRAHPTCTETVTPFGPEAASSQWPAA